MTSTKVQNLSSFAWSIAEILRGDFKQSEYGKVVLPFVVLRRLDCILEPTKASVLAAYEKLPEGIDDQTKDMMLFGAVGGGLKLYNHSQLTFSKIKGQDPADVHKNLLDYITKFNTSVRDIFLEKFLFTDQLKRLKDGGIRGGPRNSDRVLRWNPPLKTEGNYGYDQEKKSQPCLQGEGRVRGFAGRKNAVRAIGAIRGSREPDQHMEEAIIEGFA